MGECERLFTHYQSSLMSGMAMSKNCFSVGGSFTIQMITSVASSQIEECRRLKATSRFLMSVFSRWLSVSLRQSDGNVKQIRGFIL